MRLLVLLAWCLRTGASFAAANTVISLDSDDFNATAALLEQGVNVAEIPALADFNLTAASYKQSAGSSTSCTAACTALQFLYGGGEVYSRGQAKFDNFTGSYWSVTQTEVTPYCVFVPSDAAQVSVAVLLARLTQCPFAAKSGGHAAMAGASSIQNGITISFANMKSVNLSEDKSIASIEPGNLWGTVYETLAEYNLSVVGGRLFDIGVGGLTTGGGISYFSNIYGWACDNVESYDVVTATGALINASPSGYPDLYWALRGGGNNFGLVVNFNLRTIPLPGGLLWAGELVYEEDSFVGVEEAFTYATLNAGDDDKAGFYVVYSRNGGLDIAVPFLYHADPHTGSSSSVWAGFNNITAVTNTTETRVLAEWAAETATDSPHGLRELYYTITTKADVELATYARSYFFDTVSEIADVDGIVPNIVFQAIGTPQLVQMRKNGGNPLNLDAAEGPYFLILVAAAWNNEADDERVATHVSSILKAIKAEAVSRSLNVDFTYMNYASMYQDVIGSYGAENKAKLKSIAHKYDPTRVFQTLQPGYFKLDHGPVTNSSFFSY